MVKLEKRVRAFVKLGLLLSGNSNESGIGNGYFEQAINEARIRNPWFIEENIRYSLSALGESLNEEDILKWIEPYKADLTKVKPEKTVGTVMAGNIPIVGFHDFLCVLMAGHKIQAKLSSDDNVLMPAIARLLVDIEPDFENNIELVAGRLQGFDAIIATGSGNTSRYFEYYFGKYPHIIRKNRNGVAVLTGNETKGDLKNLGRDIFMYFGLGCRSISKVFVPEGYLFDGFFEAISDFEEVKNHNKYFNNYEYYRSIYLINSVDHFDNGFLMVKNDPGYSSPPSVLFSEVYGNLDELQNKLILDKEQIQCIVGNETVLKGAVPFGNGQNPGLWDYADGVDTMAFLIGL
ncbi:MAG: acyl-CoA reductase [Chlorobi bacterium]|nr:acyl-CoA reductase [Chlorobiota bacterium]